MKTKGISKLNRNSGATAWNNRFTKCDFGQMSPKSTMKTKSKQKRSLELSTDHHWRACAAQAVGIVQQTELPRDEDAEAADARAAGSTCLADSPCIALSANAAGVLRSVKFSARIMLLPIVHMGYVSIQVKVQAAIPRHRNSK